MSDACTVVIGAQHHLDALREHAGQHGRVLAFTETEVLGALEAITKHRPQIVTLERLFAATPRGAALINRIKADPALSAEIRVISHDGEYSRVSPRRGAPQAATHGSVAVAEAAPRLDWRGTRRAARFRMAAGTEAQVDGTPAALVDLSSMGAQVVAQAPLKPNQRIRIALADDSGILRVNAAVAWASCEIPKGVPQYRAGIEFRDAKADEVEAFTERHRVS
jgi:hypothetical protein